MGISGLIPFLKNATREAHIREFSGQTAAIDVYGWLHRGTFGCAERLVQGEKTDGYVRYIMKFVQVFLSHGIRPILVFDGRNLPSKSQTESKRRERRELNRKMGKEFLRDGRSKEAMDCFRKAIDITWDMAQDVIREARRQGVDVLVAPYEADAQMAYLGAIGLAHVIISEDSDLVVFGCERIFFKIDLNGSGRLYEKSLLPKCFGGATNLSFEKFRYMSIMSGCDYLPSLHGIGLAKSLKFWKSIHNPDITAVLPKIPSYLRMPQLEVTTEYIAGFLRANETFLYQLVYDPLRKELRHLTEPPEPYVERSFAGEFLDSKLAYEMAVGNVNLRTLKVCDDFDPSKPLKLHSHFKSIWSDEPMWTSTGTIKDSLPRSGSQLLMNTAFAPVAGRKRKSETKEMPSPCKRDKKMASPEKEEDDLENIYSKNNKETSPILKTSSCRKKGPIMVSKYFAIDSKDRCKDRKLERGRKNGGEWLNTIESIVTHENKFIYTTEKVVKTEAPDTSSPLTASSESSSSDKKRNPFAKTIVKSPSSPLRSPLLNIISPKGVKTEATPEKKYGSLLDIKEKEQVPKQLFKEEQTIESDSPSTVSPILESGFKSTPSSSEQALEEALRVKQAMNDTLKSPEPFDTPTFIKAKPTSKIKLFSSTASGTSSYFKKGNSKPSGLMKASKSSPGQKKLFEFYCKVDK